MKKSGVDAAPPALSSPYTGDYGGHMAPTAGGGSSRTTALSSANRWVSPLAGYREGV